MQLRDPAPSLRLTLVTALAVIAPMASAGSQTVATDVPNFAGDANPLRAGTQAPNARLRDLAGKPVSLRAVLGNKPTVLIFYRGDWCPFCNAHLADLGRVQDQIKALGYQIVAITPDEPEFLNRTLQRRQLTYGLYSDSKAEAMKKFGVAYRLDDATFQTYREKYGVDLEKFSGQSHHILPVPSVFVIDRKGKIEFVHADPNYKVRMKGDEILNVLSKLKG